MRIDSAASTHRPAGSGNRYDSSGPLKDSQGLALSIADSQVLGIYKEVTNDSMARDNLFRSKS